MALRGDAVDHLRAETLAEEAALLEWLQPDDGYFLLDTARASNRDGIKAYFDAGAVPRRAQPGMVVHP